MPTAIPVYRRIMNDIETQIKAGQLRPGDKLPTIDEMKAYYKCSGEPVKMAVRMLSASGAVVGHQGRGIYVAPPQD